MMFSKCNICLMLLAVAGIALVAAQSAEAVELYSEDFEGDGAILSDFGYALTNPPSTGPNVNLSADLGSKAARLGQGGGNQSSNRPHGSSLGSFPLVAFTADAFIPNGNNGADQGYGLSKAGSTNTLTQVTIYPAGGDWKLDTSGLFGNSSTNDIITPAVAGQLVALSLRFDTVNNTVTGSAGANSFVKAIPTLDLATQLNGFVNTTVQNINGGGVAMDLDNLVLSQFGGLPATTFTWVKSELGDWANSANWSFTGAPPSAIANSPNHTAIFSDSVSGVTNVSTNDHVTVNRIEFANTTHGYLVSGHGSVNLATTTTDTPISPTMSATGTHGFQTSVNLINDTTINTADGSTLIFDGSLNLMGKTLTKTGEGTLAINNNLLTVGGTLNCVEGMCSGTGTIGGDLVNDGGTISPGNSAGLVGNQVPEPGTLILLLVGGLLGFWGWRR